MAQLTIGITYHNEGELLTRCLKSFWSGATKPFEIIVYDDASSLRPESFIPSEIPVRIIRSELNQGPGKGRNLILKEAKGDWIHFHDADDWVSPDWCDAVLRETLQSDVVFTEVLSFQNGVVLSPSVIGFIPGLPSDQLIRFSIDHFILPAAGTFRVEVARKLQGYRESLWQSEDWDFYVRLTALNPRFKIIPESLASIEIRKESRSQKKIETLTCVLQAILLLQKELPSQFRKDLAEKAAWVGSSLFQMGEKSMAREAFDLARSLGPAYYPNQKKLYRWIASRYGQELAEWIALSYRKLIPTKLRQKVTGEGVGC